jgi:hypothetical protein
MSELRPAGAVKIVEKLRGDSRGLKEVKSGIIIKVKKSSIVRSGCSITYTCLKENTLDAHF